MTTPVTTAQRFLRANLFTPLPDFLALLPSAPRQALTTTPSRQETRFDPLTRAITAAECVAQLTACGGAAVSREYEAWLARRGFEAVHTFVNGIDHRRLYALEVEEIEAACRGTEHALSDIRKSWLESSPHYREARDFDTPFAMQHLFHGFLERRGVLPLWQDVMPYLEEEVPEHYIAPFRRATRWDQSSEQRREVLDKGLRWRLGCAYYSFLREIDLFVRLRRHHGIDVRYHLLADVTLRTDLWVDNVVVSLFVNNSTFRGAGGGGRKTPVERLFGGSDSTMRFVEFPRPTPRRFGVVDLVPEEDIEILAERIEKALT